MYMVILYKYKIYTIIGKKDTIIYNSTIVLPMLTIMH